MRSERARLTSRLDKLCLKIVRLRDNNRCQKCNEHIEGSNSHPCHVVPKGNGASWRRFDLDNIFLGCMHNHQWWHLNPTESGKWFAVKWPDKDKYLEKYRYGKPAKISTPEMRQLVINYHQKYEELKASIE